MNQTLCVPTTHGCLTNRPTSCGIQQSPFHYSLTLMILWVKNSVRTQTSGWNSWRGLWSLTRALCLWHSFRLSLRFLSFKGLPHIMVVSGQFDFLHDQPWRQRNRKIEKAEPVSPLEGQALNWYSFSSTIFYWSKQWCLSKGREGIDGSYLVDKLSPWACLWGDD